MSATAKDGKKLKTLTGMWSQALYGSRSLSSPTDPGIHAYDLQSRERVVKNLKKKAQSLGCGLVAQSAVTESVC
jgi:hypothetical protein